MAKPTKDEKTYSDSTTTTESSKNTSSNLDKYIKDFNRASQYVRNNYHSDWFDYWKVYNGKRVKIGYNSIANAFVPETRTIVESLVANIAGSQPTFEYLPTNEEQERDTKVLSELIAYYWDANHMGTKSQSWVRDSILYGNGVLHITWDADRNMPCIENVPLRDFFVAPEATCLEDARYIGFRYVGDLDALKAAEVTDPITGNLVKKYKNLDSVMPENGTMNAPELMDKEKKESLLGGSNVATEDDKQVEIILMYYIEEGKGRICEIANKCVVIRDVETPYQKDEETVEVEVVGLDGVPKKQSRTIPEIKPFFPFAILRNTIDSSLFFATGDVASIIDRQETLNDIENLDLDNIHFINNVMWRIDPAYEDMASEIESTPGIVIPIPRFGLEPIQKPSITSDLDNKKQEIKDEMRRVTGADEIIQGAAPTGSRTTATQISQQTTQAMTRFQTKIVNLESEGYAQAGSVLFKISQLFVDRDTVVRIVGDDGIVFKDFDPYEFNGEYEPHVKLDSTMKKLKEERGMKDNQLYQLIINNPVVNQREAIRMIAKSLDVDDEDTDKLLTPPAPAPGLPQQPGAPQQPQGPPQAPGVDPAQESQQAVQQAHQDFAAEQETQQAIQAAHQDFAKEQQQ